MIWIFAIALASFIAGLIAATACIAAEQVRDERT